MLSSNTMLLFVRRTFNTIYYCRPSRHFFYGLKNLWRLNGKGLRWKEVWKLWPSEAVYFSRNLFFMFNILVIWLLIRFISPPSSNFSRKISWAFVSFCQKHLSFFHILTVSLKLLLMKVFFFFNTKLIFKNFSWGVTNWLFIIVLFVWLIFDKFLWHLRQLVDYWVELDLLEQCNS